MLSFLLFVLGPMQAARLVTGQHFGYFFGLVLVPAARLSVFAKPLCSWPDRGHDPFVARSRNRVPCWPISEVAARLIEVSLLGHCGPDLLTLSSSRFDPFRTWIDYFALRTL